MNVSGESAQLRTLIILSIYQVQSRDKRDRCRRQRYTHFSTSDMLERAGELEINVEYYYSRSGIRIPTLSRARYATISTQRTDFGRASIQRGRVYLFRGTKRSYQVLGMRYLDHQRRHARSRPADMLARGGIYGIRQSETARLSTAGRRRVALSGRRASDPRVRANDDRANVANGDWSNPRCRSFLQFTPRRRANW